MQSLAVNRSMTFLHRSGPHMNKICQFELISMSGLVEFVHCLGVVRCLGVEIIVTGTKPTEIANIPRKNEKVHSFPSFILLDRREWKKRF